MNEREDPRNMVMADVAREIQWVAGTTVDAA
jgi:hypothetical protein